MPNTQSMQPMISNTGTYEVRRGGGLWTMIGLGLFSIAMAFLWLALDPDIGDIKTGLWIFIPILSSLGLVGMFGRAVTVLDLRRDHITRWWGVGWPWKTHEHALSDYAWIRITRERRSSGDGNGSTVYPVRLHGPDGKITLKEFFKYNRARNLAEDVASWLQFPLHDATDGEEVIRQPQDLNTTVRDQLRGSSNDATTIEPPETTRIVLSQERDTLKLTLPAMGMQPIHWLVVSILGMDGILGMGLLAGFLERPAIPMLVFGGVTIALTLACVGWARCKDHVMITSDLLTIRRFWGLFYSRVKLPIRELEELYINEPKQPALPIALFTKRSSILARSDSTTSIFGRGLNDDERQWVLNTIQDTIKQ